MNSLGGRARSVMARRFLLQAGSGPLPGAYDRRLSLGSMNKTRINKLAQYQIQTMALFVQLINT